MSSDLLQILDIATGIAIVGAFIFTGCTFFITRKRLRKSEQMTYMNDMEQQFFLAEDHTLNAATIGLSDDERKRIEKRTRDLQYLNIWEKFSFFVNNKEITDDKIKDYYKPTLIKDYEVTLLKYPDKLEDPSEYEELKKLYKKWKKD